MPRKKEKDGGFTHREYSSPSNKRKSKSEIVLPNDQGSSPHPSSNSSSSGEKTTKENISINIPKPQVDQTEERDTIQTVSSGKMVSGDPWIVFLLLIVLFLVISWKTIGSQIMDITWNKSSNKSIGSLDWKSVLGATVFILLATFIANISEEAGGFMIMIALALITVYIVENNGGGFSQLFNLLNPGTVTQTAPQNPPTTTGGGGGSPKV